ncbi:Protein O-mannosyl-transferase 2, partial [Armadillidium nasatum]
QFWNVKIKDGGENEPVKTLQTKFQLISPKFHCALTWSKESLSHVWGFSQGEAACTKNLKDPYSFWKIETVTNPHADNSSFDNITISFLERLAESHQVMTFINARLKPVDNFDNLDRPWMWPILYKSAPWYDVQFRIVLLGNPLLFLLNFVSLIVTPILLVIRHYKHCRNTNVKEK